MHSGREKAADLDQVSDDASGARVSPPEEIAADRATNQPAFSGEKIEENVSFAHDESAGFDTLKVFGMNSDVVTGTNGVSAHPVGDEDRSAVRGPVNQPEESDVSAGKFTHGGAGDRSVRSNFTRYTEHVEESYPSFWISNPSEAAAGVEANLADHEVDADHFELRLISEAPSLKPVVIKAASVEPRPPESPRHEKSVGQTRPLMHHLTVKPSGGTAAAFALPASLSRSQSELSAATASGNSHLFAGTLRDVAASDAVLAKGSGASKQTLPQSRHAASASEDGTALRTPKPPIALFASTAGPENARPGEFFASSTALQKNIGATGAPSGAEVSGEPSVPSSGSPLSQSLSEQVAAKTADDMSLQQGQRPGLPQGTIPGSTVASQWLETPDPSNRTAGAPFGSIPIETTTRAGLQAQNPTGADGQGPSSASTSVQIVLARGQAEPRQPVVTQPGSVPYPNGSGAEADDLATGQPTRQNDIPHLSSNQAQSGGAVGTVANSTSAQAVSSASLRAQGDAARLTERSRHFDLGDAVHEATRAAAGLAETSAPLRQPTALQSLPTADLPRQVVQQLTAVIKAGAEQTSDIVLNPAELGRVRMTLQTGESGVLVHIMTDRPETLELLRRNVDLLAQDFQAIGYGAADFSFSQGSNTRSGSAHDERPTGTSSPQPDELAPVSASDEKRNLSRTDTSDRIDIRL